MRLAVIGGGLQGLEACYLANKAGWDVTLVDKNPFVPARGLCDVFLAMDVCDSGTGYFFRHKFDAILPTLENDVAIYALSQWASIVDCPIAFDFTAYALTASKVRSAKLFSQVNIPIPRSWPSCSFPIILKPDQGSGSEGIRILHTVAQLDDEVLEEWRSGRVLLDEFVTGPSYSLEVSGTPEGYKTHQVTDLFMDKSYDCKEVMAPTVLDETTRLRLESITLRLAEAVNLRGIMDVEAIVNDGEIFVLEIDARLPSQTPTVVYMSTGVNLIEHAVLSFIDRSQRDISVSCGAASGVVYMHVHIAEGVLEITGERKMKKLGPLHFMTNFFGADEAIGNYQKGRDEWGATLLITEPDRADAIKRKNSIINAIMKHCKLHAYMDQSPKITSGGMFP